ncbi:9066_t:CDS:2 [Entrophospora sp. SA101]|nr:9066_t:CDS:2 [Entrophospora sp. SA101]
MLNDQQLKKKIQKRELEVSFRNKGINLDNLQIKIDEEGVKILQLMADKQGLDQKIINHKAREQELSKKITDLKTEVDELTKLNETLTNDYTALETEHQELQDQHNTLRGNHSSLQGNYDALLITIEDLDNLIDELKKQLNDTLNDYGALGNKYQKLNSTLEKLVDKLNKEKVIANSYREEKNEILQQGQQDRTNFLNSLRNKQNNIQELESYLDNAGETLDKKNQDIVHLLTEKDRLINQGRQKQKQIILLTQQLGTDQEKNRELIKLITRLEKKLEKQSNKRQRLIFTKELHRQRINGLTDKLVRQKDNLQAQLLNEQNISQGLQDQIDNHACPVVVPHTCPICPLIHLPEPHICPIVKKTDCSHADYETLASREKEITQQLNNSLSLNLKEPNLEKVINRIQQLIKQDPITITDNSTIESLEKELNQANQTISELEKELTPFGEDLAVIKQLELTSLEQLFNQAVDNAIKQQITQATSYQQVVSVRQAFIQKHLEQKQSIQSLPVISQTQKEIIQPPTKERII